MNPNDELSRVSPEERVILEKWRDLKDWGTVELIKQNGLLYEARVTHIERLAKK